MSDTKHYFPDERLEKIVEFAESLGYEFTEIVGTTSLIYHDEILDDRVPAEHHVLAFGRGNEAFWGDLVLLNGTFNNPAGNFCSGWLVFRNESLPEIRYIRHSDEVIEFRGNYSLDQLTRGSQE
jgi:hypothetical protein